MVDGILDLLSAILVLGVVLAVAFGFILPLTNSEIMHFDSKYEDKGALNNVIDYGNPNEYENLTRRMYTYEELLLLLNVQDTRMAAPKKINLRNLVTTIDLGYSGYGSKSGYGKSNANVNINDFLTGNANFRTELLTDEVYNGLVRYGDNHRTFAGNLEGSELDEFTTPVTEPNVGAVTITDSFGIQNSPLISELNGREIQDPTMGGSPASERYLMLSAYDEIIPPTDSRYNNRKVYFISYHFALPHTSKYIQPLTDLKRNDNKEPSYFVEIKGNNLRYRRVNNIYNVNGRVSSSYYYYPVKNIDTWAEYQDYLSVVRRRIDYSK